MQPTQKPHNLNLQTIGSTKPMLDRPLRPKNLKHPHKILTIHNKLIPTPILQTNLNKINRLRLIILVQEYLTIFDGNTRIHATINLELYYS